MNPALVFVVAFQIAVPLGLDRRLPLPEGRLLLAEEVALGERLFSEKALSRDGTVACRSCHMPEQAFADARRVAVGVRGQAGPRRSPTLINRGYGRRFFWDGRAESLEEQVLQPITNPKEMDLPLPLALERVRQAGYGELSAAQLARALAAYVRTIVAGDSPYDRFVAGEAGALSNEERDGLELFRGKANCIACHVGPNLTDEEFHNTGIGEPDDLGRAAITGLAVHRGAFKTPTLRQVAVRAPYMHDGSLATLEEVIEHYDPGGRGKEGAAATGKATGNAALQTLDEEMAPLRLTAAEKRALVAFLRALSGRVQAGWRP